MRRNLHVAGVIALTLTLGCDTHQSNDSTAPAEGFGRAQAAIVDGNSGGNAYFKFVPPTVANTGQLATANDNKLNPEMDICVLEGGQCGSVVWSFSRANKQPQNRTLKVGNSFNAEWETALSNLDPARTYRVRVKLDQRVIGFADVDVVATAAELAGVDAANYIGVVRGSKVKLNFWISSGIFSYITGKTGGTAAAAGGLVKLEIPKNATEDVHIGILPGAAPNVPGAIIVPNTYYEFIPDGHTFSKPAQLRILVDPKWIPSSIRPGELRMLRLKNGAWSEVAGAVVELNKNQVRGDISGFSGYALGKLTSVAQPIVDVEITTQQITLGRQFEAVQRVRNAAAQISCTNNLRQLGLPASNLYLNPGNIAIVNGACPFTAFVARAGSDYQIDANVDGINGLSNTFAVTLPSGARLVIQNVPSGPHYADGNVPTGGISVVAQDGAGTPLQFVDVDVSVAGGGSFNFGGAPTNLFPARTDANGVINLPPGNWHLAPAPGTNTLGAVLPGTAVAAAHDVVTTSGVATRIFAPALPGSVPQAAPTGWTLQIRDNSNNVVNTDVQVTATLTNSNGTFPLRVVDVVDGLASFDLSFAQPAYNNTVTLSSPGLASHTSNAFTIWQVPGAPTYSFSNPQSSSLDLGVSFAALFGANPRRVIELTRLPDGGPGEIVLPYPAQPNAGSLVDVFNGLQANTRYRARVRSCIDEGCSAFGPASEGLTRPALLSGVAASNIGETSVTILWNTPNPADGLTYTVYREVAGSATPVCSATVPNCQVTGLTPATTYQFSVEACNASGCGVRSPAIPVTTLTPPPPPQPTAVSASGYTTTSMNVGISNVIFAGTNPRFELRFLASPGGTAQTLNVPMNNAALQPFPAALSGLLPGTLYDISARACDSNGCSPFSMNILVPTLQPPPQGLAASNLTTTSAVITWSDPAIPNGVPHDFQVYLQQGSNPQQLVTTVTSPTATLSGLSANTSYTVEVRACNASGCSPAQVSFMTPPPPLPPGAPNRLQINSQAFNAIVLAWSDNSSNEDGFRVMRRVLPSTTFTQVGVVGSNVATFTDTDLIQGLTVVYRVDAFNAGGTSSSNETSTIVPTGQTTAMAPWGTTLTQTGTANVAAPSPPRVRLINGGGTAAVGVPVTFTITSPIGSFVQLVPRQTVVVVNTNTSGIATAPAFIVQAGVNTVAATATGFNTVNFTVNAN